MRHVSAVFVLALLLAGCGGRAAHLLPSGRLGPDNGARAPRSSNTTTFNGTLWYGDDRSLYGIPLTNGPAPVRLDGSYAGLVGPSSRAMTIARDGTVYELIQNNARSLPVGWQLRIYAPGSHGAATPEETLSGSGYPLQVLLVADGIDVLSSTKPRGIGGTSTLSTFAYGTASNAQPTRTLSLGANVTDAASDRNNQIYVARNGAGIAVYGAGARCMCSPIRTIATGLTYERSLAVADDGTVYVLSDDPRNEVANVNAYAPGNNGPAASRVLGPFYESIDVAPMFAPVSSPTGGITVDAAGDVYIGFADNAGQVRVEMYGPHDSGAPNPARTIATPAFSTYITSITIGPALPSAAVAPTLYVASADHVFAFDANASGSTPPQRTIGFFYVKGPVLGGPQSPPVDITQLAGIATAPDGTLATISNTISFGFPPNPSCQFAFFAADANGTAAHLSTPYCPGYATRGIARGLDGELDVLMTAYNTNVQIVERLVNGVPVGSFQPHGPSVRNGIAVDGSGNVFLSTEDGHVEQYPRNSAGDTPFTRSFPLAGDLGAMCFAPDGTQYVAGEIRTTSPQPPFDVTSQDYIYAVLPGAFGAARTAGPYADRVTALACDSQGRLYAGFYRFGNQETAVGVFPPNFGGGPPLWTLNNPVPANEPGGQVVTGLALSP